MTPDSLHRFLKSVSCRQVHEPSQSIFDEAGSQTLRKSILRQQNEFITITKNIKNAADVGCGDNCSAKGDRSLRCWHIAMPIRLLIAIFILLLHAIVAHAD